ncbi:hybrid sensor histidine kinase/response regulator [Paenibacillus flagellatus]|uniref:histidine kinase n=1 Tax=Paenibacillus flagellatus TaxID=2211139 RepID=A0A2V5K7N9_9BACL|nr:ATP-binding protein [Paenibacillus flagellatus]PYI54044.1 histidine kinase [Paenibacillus flagellatus]
MTKTKILLITALFLMTLSGLRLLWVASHMPPGHPEAVRGVLDLRGWDFDNGKPIPLDGEWAFFPGQWMMSDVRTADPAGSNGGVYLPVPGAWDRFVSGAEETAYGFGTYRLQIRVGDRAERTYGIQVRSIHGASDIWVNGQPLAGSGQIAATREPYKLRNVPYSAFFSPEGGVIDVAVRVSNFDYATNGGIVRSISFGSAAAVRHDGVLSMGMSLTVGIVLGIHGLYAAILYVFRPRQKALIYFSLLVLSTALTVLTNYDMLLFSWLPLDFEWSTKLKFWSYIGTSAFMVLFTKHLFPEYGKYKISAWFSAACAAYALFVLFAPASYAGATEPLLYAFNVIPSMVAPVLWLRAALRGREDVLYMLLSAAGVASHVIWGVLANVGLYDAPYYPLDIVASFFSMAAFWFKRFFRATEQTELLAERLQKAHRQKDEFLANTSHELRNPLHGILHIAESIAANEGRSLGDKARNDLELLLAVGRRMSFLLNDLLDATRLQEENVRLNLSAVRLQASAAGVLDMLRFMTDGKNIKLVLNVPDTFPCVLADENRLVQILFNLLHNAVKYTNEGQIAITAEVRDGKACVLVSDTGVGMDEETRRRVFEPYERGETGMTATASGLGLGLSISARLVELHGGTLTVESEPGRGSVFSFALPLSECPESEEVEAARLNIPVAYEEAATAGAIAASSATVGVFPPPDFIGDRPKVLVVDDDPVNLKIMTDLLTAEHCEVVAVMSGTEALKKLCDTPWDLVVADVMMPHMSGYELTSVIRERFGMSELPILLLTARSRPEDVSVGFKAGANDYVTKPVDALELKARVNALIGLSRSSAERRRLEAAWLHAQIKPHFLYNTLNSIAALSEFDTKRMRDMLDMFGHYLRTSFDFRNLDRHVPLRHELEIVRSYLFIEKERFGDRLQVVWETEQADLERKLPPISVQTLVENAVRHGVLRRPRGGTIRIRITERDDRMHVEVEDDGVGMSDETMRELFAANRTGAGKRRGVGLYNLDRRLRQMYGSGLHVHSVPEQGTIVRFDVPKPDEDDPSSANAAVDA